MAYVYIQPEEKARRIRLVEQAKLENPGATKAQLSKLCGLSKKQLNLVERDFRRYGYSGIRYLGSIMDGWTDERSEPIITRRCAKCHRRITEFQSWHDDGRGPQHMPDCKKRRR